MGRLVAMFFNYGMARKAVFLSRAPHHQTLPRYALLVLVNGFVSYALLDIPAHTVRHRRDRK